MSSSEISKLADDLGLTLGVLRGRIQIVEPLEEPLSMQRPQCLRTCGTQYRGCDPKCVSRLMDEHEDLQARFKEAGELFLKLREELERSA